MRHATVTASGYSLVQADSDEAVQSLLANHPHLQTPEATIEVLELMIDDFASVAYWYQAEPHTPFPAFPGIAARWGR